MVAEDASSKTGPFDARSGCSSGVMHPDAAPHASAQAMASPTAGRRARGGILGG
jgi:hypothetical protein